MTNEELEKLAAYHGIDLTQIRYVANEVMGSLIKAKLKHERMHSAHEGYAVILEEVDELWDEVKQQRFSPFGARREALHIAAMGMRFVLDVCQGENMQLPEELLEA